jgi:twinkle protein
MSVFESGYPFVTSVPNGAPKKVLEQLPSREDDGRFAYIYEAMEDLRAIKDIVLATDDDPAGYALRDELIRRLGQARCRWVKYPEGCKDLNDVLMKFGPSRTINVAHSAGAVPLAGVHRFSDYPRVPDPRPMSTGIQLLDGIFKPYEGEFIVVTGIPNGGKSLFTNWVHAQLLVRHGIKTGLGSYETYPPTRTLRMLMGCCAGKSFDLMDDDEKSEWARFVNRGFVIIDNKGDPAVSARLEERFRTVDWFLAKCHDAILRHDCRFFVVDPWNELEHARPRHETDNDYISRAIHKIRTFCEMMRCTITVVAHPKKMEKNHKGLYEVPGLYDINGSAAWYNRSDHGVIVHRPVKGSPRVQIFGEKVRYQPEAGVPGDISLIWDPRKMTYTSTTGD